MTTKPFIAVEIGMYQPGGSSSSYVFAAAAAPWGALALDPEPLEADGTLFISDDGYTTKATDPDGVVVYPPVINGSFAIDRSLGLTPADGSTVNWGAIQVIDPDERIASLMRTWNIDGQTVTILRGEKEFEDFTGQGTVRSTKGTYIDAAGVMREAAAETVRWDYSGGPDAVALDEAAATNYVRNPRGEGAVASSGTELVTNGGFALDPIDASQNTIKNGWQWSRTGGTTTVTWGSGAVTITPDGTNQGRIDTSFITAIGKTYVATVDVSTNTIAWGFGNTQGSSALSTGQAAAGAGRRRVFTATATTTWMRMSRTTAGATTVDNVSVKEAGTLPTYWGVTAGSSALAYTVTGAGTDAGVPYVDIRVAGLTASTAYSITFDSAIAGTKDEAWATSVWVKLQAGSLSNVTSVSLELSPSTGTLITGVRTPDGTLTRKNKLGTLTATAILTPQITLAFLSGVAIDATFRLGAPQAEIGAAATTNILAPAGAPAATLRAADKLFTARRIWTNPAYGDLDVVFTGMADTWQSSEAGITFPLRGADYWLDQPAQQSVYAGTGTYEGDAALTGHAKPKGRGTFYNVEPVLISASKLIYQYTDGAGTITGLYENGNAGIVFESDTANLFSGTTTAGKYRTDNTRGLFQLGSAPAGQITVNGTGQFPVAGNKTVLADIARYVLTEELAIPTDFIDTTSFSDAATTYAYSGGIWLLPGETGAQAVDRLLSSFGAKLTAARDGKLRVIALAAPSGTPVAALGTHNVVKIEPVALPSNLNPPPYRVRCAYRHNYTVQTNVSASATAAQVQFAGAEDRFSTFVDLDVLAAYRKPNDISPFGGCLDGSANAQAVADRIGAMLSTLRRLYAVTVPLSVGTGIDVGNVVQIIYPLDVLRDGALGRVHREQFRSQSDITFLVFV